ncbi:MAG TPA: hypothetical protein VHG08_10660 [Longimicrobium sp.]|nr:hypothetical protein [Longimicrobium sp.]
MIRAARWSAAAAFAAVLGAGTAQAFATPSAPEAAALTCSNSYCSWWCVKQGYDGGACDANGECLCLYAWP